MISTPVWFLTFDLVEEEDRCVSLDCKIHAVHGEKSGLEHAKLCFMVTEIKESSMEVVALFSPVRILGECLIIHSPHALLFLFLFFKVDISSRTLIPLFTPGSVHSGSAS